MTDNDGFDLGAILASADRLRQLFLAYTTAGFTEDQALRLVLALFPSARRGPVNSENAGWSPAVMVVEFSLPNDVNPPEWWAEVQAIADAVPPRFRTRISLGIMETADAVIALFPPESEVPR